MAIFGAILFVVGYSIGYMGAMSFCVDVAMRVADIEINPDILKHLILKYGENI